MSRRTRAGRRPGSERIRELVSVLGSLSRTGDTVTIDALANRLGISTGEASDMMGIVCQASGEETGGLLICANDDMTEFTLAYPGAHGYPLRLTYSETMALVHALDYAEVPSDDPIRQRLVEAYASPGVKRDEVRRSLGSPGTPSLTSTLRLCARAQSEERMLSFMYVGLADRLPRARCVLVRRLRVEDSSWYIDAHDLDALQERTFRLDRMEDVSLGPRGRLPRDGEAVCIPARNVEVTFYDPSYLTLFDWPGLRITKRTTSTVSGVLPYYGDRSDWLLRRIAACAGNLVVHDERIMLQAKEYVCHTLGPEA